MPYKTQYRWDKNNASRSLSIPTLSRSSDDNHHKNPIEKTLKLQDYNKICNKYLRIFQAFVPLQESNQQLLSPNRSVTRRATEVINTNSDTEGRQTKLSHDCNAQVR